MQNNETSISQTIEASLDFISVCSEPITVSIYPISVQKICYGFPKHIHFARAEWQHHPSSARRPKQKILHWRTKCSIKQMGC